MRMRKVPDVCYYFLYSYIRKVLYQFKVFSVFKKYIFSTSVKIRVSLDN